MTTRSTCRGICMAAVLAALPAIAFAEGGTIKGKITLEGGKDAAPKRTVVQMTADPFCEKANEKKVGTENAIVGKDGEVANVIVYIKDGLGDQKFDAPGAPTTIDQIKCMYDPHVMTVQVGQTFTVKNSDETLHNIHGLPQKNEEFNFGQPKAGMTKDLSFKRAEIFKIKCDVHPWMSAYVGVFDHPFHVVTGKDGTFEIKGLPAGKYEVAAWHETFGEMTQSVEVASDATVETNFEMKAAG